MAKLAPDVLVEHMVTGAVAELIIGLKTDPQFGLALVIGAGGILTELLKDTVTLLLPTSRAEIERALKSLEGLETGRRLPRQVGRPARRHRGGRGRGRLRRAHRGTASRNSTSIPCSCCPTAPSPSMR